MKHSDFSFWLTIIIYLVAGGVCELYRRYKEAQAKVIRYETLLRKHGIRVY